MADKWNRMKSHRLGAAATGARPGGPTALLAVAGPPTVR